MAIASVLLLTAHSVKKIKKKEGVANTALSAAWSGLIRSAPLLPLMGYYYYYSDSI